MNFTILDTQMRYLEREKWRYKGKCARCNASIDLRLGQIEILAREVGGITFEERLLNFDSLFGVKD